MDNSSDCILPALFIPLSVFTHVSSFREISAVVDVAAKPSVNLVFYRRPAEAARVVAKPLTEWCAGRHSVCQCFCQSHTIWMQRLSPPAKPELLYSLFMRENGIKSVRYRLWIFWPGTLFSLAAVLQVCWKEAHFFPHIYKWALFMYSPGTACFLKGFMRIWLYI